MVHLYSSEVQQLLHNKFVVIVGDSIQRSVYKDLVLLLQKDCLLTDHQLKIKGELSFEQDTLLVGGQTGPMHNGVQYREVRQFCSGHHLVRFYFVTRAYSDYLEAILEELRAGPEAPDVFIMNSCLWDLGRYGRDWGSSYRENLESLFARLAQVLPRQCLLLWTTTMPVGKRITASFLEKQQQQLRWVAALHEDVIVANFYSAQAAARRRFDVLDLHFHFRHSWQHRQGDGVHWNECAHRHLSQLLLAHVADAWGVDLPQRDPMNTWIKRGRGRGRAGRGPHRQHQVRGQPATFPPPPLLPPPLLRPPLLPYPPPLPPPAPSPLALPCPTPLPQFLPYAQDPYSFSDQPPQSDHFASCFHMDVPLPPTAEFAMEGDLVFRPPSHMPHPHPPYYQHQAPIVSRGFPRCTPPGPYWRPGRDGHARRRPRPSKRQASRARDSAD
ncbi:PC-esterase domain-containing protein 1B [Tenrec ecaudatus]|uniref:PC-esterase domain-containing protein 1B n=1 Tax=Tenrec ecaudatus TaxID=94439 RepID=UPI003F591F71